MELKDLREKLRAPLPEEAIKPHPSKSYLSTIKAIYVTERLNDVFGLNGWTTQTDMIHWFEKKIVKDNKERIEYTAVLKTVIAVPAYGIRHECIASSTNEDLGDAAKGATTDAITKIGSYLEIGIDVFKGLSAKSAKPTKTTKPVVPTQSSIVNPTITEQPTTSNPTPTTETKEWLNPGTPNWEHAKKRLKDGMTIEYLEGIFRISKENKTKLQNETK